MGAGGFTFPDLLWTLTNVRESPLEPQELEQAEDHYGCGAAEPQTPADSLSEIAANQGSDDRAGVDAHVKDREAGIAASVFLRVKTTDHRADIRL